jgi:hypothetical protein
VLRRQELARQVLRRQVLRRQEPARLVQRRQEPAWLGPLLREASGQVLCWAEAQQALPGRTRPATAPLARTSANLVPWLRMMFQGRAQT